MARGLMRTSNKMGRCTHGMRKWVPSGITLSAWIPWKRSNIIARWPASTTYISLKHRTIRGPIYLYTSIVERGWPPYPELLKLLRDSPGHSCWKEDREAEQCPFNFLAAFNAVGIWMLKLYAHQHKKELSRSWHVYNDMVQEILKKMEYLICSQWRNNKLPKESSEFRRETTL